MESLIFNVLKWISIIGIPSAIILLSIYFLGRKKAKKIKKEENIETEAPKSFNEEILDDAENFANRFNESSKVLNEGVLRKQTALVREKVNEIQKGHIISLKEENDKKEEKLLFQRKLKPQKKKGFIKHKWTILFGGMFIYIIFLVILTVARKCNIDIHQIVPLMKNLIWPGLIIFSILILKSIIENFLKWKQNTIILKNITKGY